MNDINELKKMQSAFETQIEISNDNEVFLNGSMGDKVSLLAYD